MTAALDTHAILRDRPYSMTHPSPARPARLAPLLDQLRNASVPRLASEADFRTVFREDVGLRQLHALAEQEPGLAVQILQQANGRMRAGDDLRGVQQGIHLLGSRGIQRLLHAQSAPPLDIAKPGHRLSLQAMATTRLAWLYLAHWLRSNLSSDEDSRLSHVTLLGLARWKLPLVQPSLATHIESRVQAGERRVRVERELLGADLDAINLWHLEDLGLQEVAALFRILPLTPQALASLARHAWIAATPLTVPALLKPLLRERLLGCALAHALALETQADWYSLRTSRLLRAASTWLGKPLEDTLRGLQRQALFASDEPIYTRGLRAPAVGLLWPPRHARSLARRQQPSIPGTAGLGNAPAPSGSTRPATTTLSAGNLVAAFQRRCETGHADLRGLLIDTVHLFGRLGMKRCALFLRHTEQDLQACYFSHGFAAGQADRGLSFSLTPDSLITQLLSKPSTAFRIQPQQCAAVIPKLPSSLSSWPPADGFVLAAVTIRGRAVGFWWADAGLGSPLAPIDFAGFRYVVEVFTPAFTRSMASRAQAAMQNGSN